MDAAQLHPWLKLAHAPGLGPVAAGELLRRFGSPQAICGAPHSELRDAGITEASARFLRGGGSHEIDAQLVWHEPPGHYIVTSADSHYPQRLKALPDAPILLYLAGDPEVLGTLQLAMVGSRKPTPTGARTARDFARHLAGRGLVITSGLALGIDAASHHGALLGGGLTVAVIGTGHAHCYPAANRELADSILEEGAIVSELPFNTPPRRDNFPRRNRIISGLSAGVLVVEAAVRSGSLITARLAGEQGREVFAIPGSIHSPQSRGTNHLIRQGATLVETAEDVLRELAPHLGSEPESTPAETAASTTPSLAPDYLALLAAIDYAPTSVDTLVMNTSFSAAEIASMLLILELQGHVQAVDGGGYMRCA